MGLTITMVIDHLLTVMILPVVVSNYFMALTKMVIGVISPYLSGPHHNSTYNSGQTSSRPHTSFYPKRWQIVGKIAGYFREIEIVEMIESWLVNLPHPTYPHNYNHGSLSFWNHVGEILLLRPPHNREHGLVVLGYLLTPQSTMSVGACLSCPV